jgi:hypothetical protein
MALLAGEGFTVLEAKTGEAGQKQQMRWAPKGGYLLLQVRAKVLNDKLAEFFQPWHPAFDAPPGQPSQRSWPRNLPRVCSLSVTQW